MPTGASSDRPGRHLHDDATPQAEADLIYDEEPWIIRPLKYSCQPN